MHTITAEMIRELHNYAENTGNPAETALVLTDEGWESRVTPGGWPTDLIAITAEDIHGWLDGEELDDDCCEALTTPDPQYGTTYQLRNEHGEYQAPSGDTWRVVTDDAGSDDTDIAHWTSAWWFDMDDATEIVAEHTVNEGSNERHSVWRAAGGTWLLRVRTSVGSRGEFWAHLTPSAAAAIVYADNGDHATDVETPLGVAAQMVAEVSEHLRRTREQLGRMDIDDLAELAEAQQAVSELIRSRLLADIRESRVRVAREVSVRLGSQKEAAERLGISPQTLSGLLG